MIGKRLFKILNSLSPDEFRQFRKAILSPVFGTGQSLLPLYDFLSKFYPDFVHSKLNAASLYAKLYPGKAYKEGVLRVKIHQLTKLTEEYLVWLQVRSDDFKYKHLLVEAYGKRNLHAYFAKGTQELISDQQTQPSRDVEYYQTLAKLNAEFYFHPLTEKYTLRDHAITELMDQIDKQYALLKLRIGSELKSRASTLQKKYAIPFLKQMLTAHQNGFMQDNKLFRLYHLLFQLYGEANHEEVYHMVKTQLHEDISEIRKFDRSLLLTQLINYTVRQINQGNLRYYREALDLYKTGLDYDLVIENNAIEEATFGNIVLLACHAEEFSWTKSFIENYQIYLKDDIREDVIALHKGLWHFHQHDFEKAYSLFHYHPFSHVYQPKARLNLIKTVFEQFLQNKNLYDFLKAQLESFEKFLVRSKLIAAYQITTYRNFILITRNLANSIYRNRNPGKVQQALLEQIAKKKSVIAKDWLLAKIKQLA